MKKETAIQSVEQIADKKGEKMFYDCNTLIDITLSVLIFFRYILYIRVYIIFKLARKNPLKIYLSFSMKFLNILLVFSVVYQNK